MLHGCRSDLILNCLVKSNKDRNLYLYLVSVIQLLKYKTIFVCKQKRTTI